MNVEQIKHCPKCKLDKVTSLFFKDKSKKSGFAGICKECHKQVSLEYARRNVPKGRETLKLWRKNNPWHWCYLSCRQRCLNKKSTGYKYYGGKGVKLLMTPTDFKFLWFRDFADLMKKPTIDRINSDGNYEISNCRFIENSENIRRALKERYSKISI